MILGTSLYYGDMCISGLKNEGQVVKLLGAAEDLEAGYENRQVVLVL